MSSQYYKIDNNKQGGRRAADLLVVAAVAKISLVSLAATSNVKSRSPVSPSFSSYRWSLRSTL